MPSTTTVPSSSKSKKSTGDNVDNEIPAPEVRRKVEEAESTPESLDEDGDIRETSPSKKRKRDVAQASELEIDVSLPEPPSKKALRKAKKQKPTGTPTSAPKTDPENTDDDQDEEPKVAASSAAEVRSGYGIWIGNLPFTTTKPLLRTFLTSPESRSGITDAQITRVHMPAPANAAATRTQLKPLNKGFAYVDFATKEALVAALALSETLMGGRRVLIKDSKSFEGRPEKSATEAGVDGELNRDAGKKGAAKATRPAKRVFVGNLGFDVTKEDLKDFYSKCGDVVDIHMATFEDSGKCKGFAWVTFAELEASEAAVRGWVKIPEPDDEDDEDAEEIKKEDGAAIAAAGDGDVADTSKRTNNATAHKAKKQKTRKWFVNRLLGRPVRCEYAEDATSRYKKRFGKEAGNSAQHPGIEEVSTSAHKNSAQSDSPRRRKDPHSTSTMQPGAATDRNKRRGKVAGQPDVNYRTGAITESAGTKVTFG